MKRFALNASIVLVTCACLSFLHAAPPVFVPLQSTCCGTLKGTGTGTTITEIQPSWKLTVSEPQTLVDIDPNGTVTIHGDVHTRAFWERVAAAFKEDCPQQRTLINSITTPDMWSQPGRIAW